MQGQDRKTLQLSAAQILSGALASVSAAVVASVFGVAGTLIGAALTSVVATVGGALYTHSLERARERVRLRRAVARPPIPAAPPSGVPPAWATGAARGVSWGAIRVVAGASALAFVLAIGMLTAAETVAGRPVAELVGHPPPAQSETTLGALVQQVTAEGPADPGAGAGDAEATPEATGTAAPTPRAPGAIPAPTGTAAAPAPAKPTPAKPTPESPTPTPQARNAPVPTAPAKPASTPAEEAPARPTSTTGR